MNSTVIGLVAFKLGWFSLVLWPQWSQWIVMVALLVLLVKMPLAKRLSWLLLVGVGIALDIILLQSGFIRADAQFAIPLWLAVMWGWFVWAWLGFFQALFSKSWQILLFCAVGGPLAYQGGAALSDAMQVSTNLSFLALHAVAWLIWGAITLLLQQWQSRQRGHYVN